MIDCLCWYFAGNELSPARFVCPAGIAFNVFIVTASLSRFSASVVSKSNARKLLKKQQKAARARANSALKRLRTSYRQLKQKEILVKIRRWIRTYFLLFSVMVQVAVVLLLYFGTRSPPSCGICETIDCDTEGCEDTIVVIIPASTLCIKVVWLVCVVLFRPMTQW